MNNNNKIEFPQLALLENLAKETLTAREEVIVIEIWNRSLAFQSMVLDCFQEKLFIDCPDIGNQIGNTSIEIAIQYFFRVFEDAIREIRPTQFVNPGTLDATTPSPIPSLGECVDYFAELGFTPQHWYHVGVALVFSLRTHSPYLLEDEIEDLSHSLHDITQCAFFKWYCKYVAMKGIDAYYRAEARLSSKTVKETLSAYWKSIANSQENRDLVAQQFYKDLLGKNPEITEFFRSTDMDYLSKHFMESLTVLISVSSTGGMRGINDIRKILEAIANKHRESFIPSWAYPLTGDQLIKTLDEYSPLSDDLKDALSYIYKITARIVNAPMFNEERLFQSAADYFGNIIAPEWGWSDIQLTNRLLIIQNEISTTSTYRLTSEEISYGARVAWRNSAKCVGRVNWKSMIVRDFRHLRDPQEIFEQCVEHLRIATGGENIVSVMTVFREKHPQERWGPRFWNSQFMRYAGWELEDGSVLGDPANVELTKAILSMFPHWKPSVDGKKTAHDVLPMVYEAPSQPPILFEWPEEVRYQVNIEHPEEPRFYDELQLRWCTVPTISNFGLVLGGIHFTCLPFNGWFAEIEITRNLWERYKIGPKVAKIFNLDTSQNSTMWQDKAYSEINRAVYYSFVKSKFSIVDHHSVCQQFQVHIKREKEEGREVPGMWSWIGGLLGPMANSACTGSGIWHHEMRNFELQPQYLYQSDIFIVKELISHKEEAEKLLIEGGEQHSQQHVQNLPKPIILFGSETGSSEDFANKLAKKLRTFQVKILSINSLTIPENMHLLGRATHLYVVTSTFGSGKEPTNANLYDRLEFPNLAHLQYAVLGLGSSVYPHFCGFGKRIDSDLQGKFGAKRMMTITTADEIHGQAAVCLNWIDTVVKHLCASYGIDPSKLCEAQKSASAETSTSTLKFVPVEAVLSHENEGEEAKGEGKVTSSYKPYHCLPKIGNALSCRILSNSELLDVESEIKEIGGGNIPHSTRKIEIDISPYEEISYESGDHISICPFNLKEEVESMLHYFGIDGNVLVNIVEMENGEEFPSSLRIPLPATYFDIISFYLDLTLREGMVKEIFQLAYQKMKNDVKHSLLKEKPPLLQRASQNSQTLSLSDLGPRPTLTSKLLLRSALLHPVGEIDDEEIEEGEEVLNLSADNQKNKIEPRERKISFATIARYVSLMNDAATNANTSSMVADLERKFSEKYFSVIRFLEAIPVHFSFEEMFPIFRRLKPRYYSISSSNRQSPRQVHITVSIVRHGERKGVCSNYLASLQKGECVFAALHKSHFRAPLDPKAPMICIGIGTGLAPMMGFIED